MENKGAINKQLDVHGMVNKIHIKKLSEKSKIPYSECWNDGVTGVRLCGWSNSAHNRSPLNSTIGESLSNVLSNCSLQVMSLTISLVAPCSIATYSVKKTAKISLSDCSFGFWENRHLI